MLIRPRFWKKVAQHGRIYEDALYHNIINMSQSGFQQRRKTTDHILRLHYAIHKSLVNKHNVLSVFIDIEKGYDMVNKEVLLYKLLRYGISGRMFSFIRSFLSSRTFQARIGPTLSMTKRLKRFPASKRP